MLVVQEAHAATDPWAVVVHLEDAPVAYAAVVGSRRLQDRALLAEAPHHDVLQPPVGAQLAVVAAESHLDALLSVADRAVGPQKRVTVGLRPIGQLRLLQLDFLSALINRLVLDVKGLAPGQSHKAKFRQVFFVEH